MPEDAKPWIARNLRATRADPPGLAAEDDYRRALYGASLEQFEQLLKAAENVDAAARPLPLFYALSQAGRAIVAAHGENPDIDGHGLAEDRDSAPDDILQRRIKRTPKSNGKDAFGAVARATGSPDITGGLEIGAIWAALPQTYRLPEESWLPEWRIVLWLMDQPGEPPASGQVRHQVMSILGNPHVAPEQTMHGRYPTFPDDTRWALKGNPDPENRPGSWAVVVEWSADHDLDRIAPEIGPSRQLIPTLPGQSEIVSPLMTWWLLAFGLSIFARYHPGLWLRALQVDRSPAAVPLEAVLDTALGLLPHLVYDEVLRVADEDA
jgi:hypothetical protein